MAAKTKKADPQFISTGAAKKRQRMKDGRTAEEYPTRHGDYELEMGLPEDHRYEVAKTNRPTHYYNTKGWVVRIVPAGSMVALAVYVHGVLVEEGTMDVEAGREYAAALLDRGFKKVHKMF
jgi:hypothetical protein